MNTDDNVSYDPFSAADKVREMLSQVPVPRRPNFGLAEFKSLAMPLVDWFKANQPNVITFQVILDIIDSVCYKLGFIYTSDSCSPHEAAIQNLRLVRQSGLNADHFELDEEHMHKEDFAKYCYELCLQLTEWFMAQGWNGPQIAASLEAVKVGLELVCRPKLAARLEVEDKLATDTGFNLGFNPAS